MLNSFYNWFLNTFIRINPYVKTTIFLLLMVAILWLLQRGLKKSKASEGTKLKDWGISYFVASFLVLILAFLIVIL